MKTVVFLFAALCCQSVWSQESPPTVRVFILAGQSNMQGHAVVDMDHPEHYNAGQGNLNDVMANSDGRFAHLKSNDEWTVRDDVFVRYETGKQLKRGGLSIGYSAYEDGRHFGPELQFGHVIGDHFDEPVLLIKTAWGGKSLHKDFRPPSAVKARGGETGPYFLQMVEEVNAALQQAPEDFPAWKDAHFEITGFVWQQGWNDMGNKEATQEYFANLVDLITDLREIWGTPNLPVVVGELGNGGPQAEGSMKAFRRQQSRIDAHPPFVGNVLFAPTANHARAAERSPNIGHGHHWFGNAESYLLVGDSLGKQMLKLLSQASQPRVLILGDSISIGYTPHVQKSLQQDALIVRPMLTHKAAENCAGTDKGIQEIDRWLSIGGGKWDVIHFNFGLHDLKRTDAQTGRNSNDPKDPYQSSPAEYEIQLGEIVKKLKQSGATLIFATTTPVPLGVKPHRDPTDPVTYNRVAESIMQANDIQINNLYQFANPILADIQRSANVHFTPAGSARLGEQVAEQIRAALGDR